MQLGLWVRKFIPIFPEIFISRKFHEILTKNTVQTLQITVYLFTSSLSIGFYSTSQCTNSNTKALFSWLNCSLALHARSHWDPYWFHDYRQYLQLGQISGNFLLELNFRKIYNPTCSYHTKHVTWSILMSKAVLYGLVNYKDNRNFRDLRFEFESAVCFDAIVIGRFKNFRIESAVPAPCSCS